MNVLRWLTGIVARAWKGARAISRRKSVRLSFECLEDRTTPSILDWTNDRTLVCPPQRAPVDESISRVESELDRASTVKQLVIVDSATPNYQALLDDLIRPGTGMRGDYRAWINETFSACDRYQKLTPQTHEEEETLGILLLAGGVQIIDAIEPDMTELSPGTSRSCHVRLTYGGINPRIQRRCEGAWRRFAICL